MALCAKHSAGSNYGHSGVTAVWSPVESKNQLALFLKRFKKLTPIRKKRYYLTVCLLFSCRCAYMHSLVQTASANML